MSFHYNVYYTVEDAGRGQQGHTNKLILELMLELELAPERMQLLER